MHLRANPKVDRWKLAGFLQAELAGTPVVDEGIAEVERYVAAIKQGYELVRTLPLTQRLILQLHDTLLSGATDLDLVEPVEG